MAGTTIVHHDVLISEVADYELRRELLRIGSQRSLHRLDELTRELTYIPMATSTWRAAAKLWRRFGVQERLLRRQTRLMATS